MLKKDRKNELIEKDEYFSGKKISEWNQWRNEYIEWLATLNSEEIRFLDDRAEEIVKKKNKEKGLL